MRTATLVVVSLIVWQSPFPAAAQTGLCSDSRTTGLVKRLYRQSLDKFVVALGVPTTWANEIDRAVPVDVKAIRTVRIDQGVGRHHCQATLEARLTAQGAEAVNNPVFQAGLAQNPDLRGFQIRGAVASHPVRYTVQHTDDKKQIIVEAVGQENLADLVFNATIREVNDKMTGSPRQEPKAAPARTSATQKLVDACIDRKIAAFRKQHGPEAPIRVDVLDEWEEQCASSAKR
jgi:hypothetical protein